MRFRETAPGEVAYWRLLSISRVAILVASVLSALLFAISLPFYYNQFVNLTATGLADATPLRANPTQSGISLQFYALYNLGLAVGLALACDLLSAVIFWRRPRDPMALVMAFSMVVLGVTYSGSLNALAPIGPLWAYLAHSENFLNIALFDLIFLTFPDGRFVPAWTRAIYLPILAAQALPIYFPGSHLDPATWPSPWFGAFSVLSWATPVIAQLYRFTRVANTRQKQQLKWVVFGFSAGALSTVAIHAVLSVLEEAAKIQIQGTAWDLFSSTALNVSIFLFPLSLAIGILRYRLYDIDVIINRTLVYATLTALLAGLYFGSVLALEALIRPITGQAHNDLAIVVSTLIIAALFMPLRRWIQAFIDRRFYRRKYDAARTLAAFGQVARDEVDLDVLTGKLVSVVNETMQPEHVSLWLSADRIFAQEKPL